MMNKDEFLVKIIDLYDDFNDKNTGNRIHAYNSVLKGDIDYQKLYDDLMQTYESFNCAPSPAHLYKLIEKERRRLYEIRLDEEYEKRFNSKD